MPNVYLIAIQGAFVIPFAESRRPVLETDVYTQRGQDIALAVSQFDNLKPFAKEIGASYREFIEADQINSTDPYLLKELRKYAFQIQYKLSKK